MKKLIRLLLVVIGLTTIVVSCSDDDTSEEYESIEELLEDTVTYNYAYIENAVDSMDAIFTQEGYVVLINDGGLTDDSYSDSCTLEVGDKVIYLTQIDTITGEVDDSMNICIVIDSSDNISMIQSQDVTILLSNVTDYSFDCIVMQDGLDDIYLTDVQWDGTAYAKSSRSSGYLATADIEDVLEVINKVQDYVNIAFDITGKIKDIADITTGEKLKAYLVSEALGYVANALTANLSPELVLVGTTINNLIDFYKKNSTIQDFVFNELSYVVSLAFDKLKEFIDGHVGRWLTHIFSASQSGMQECIIGYSIAGIDSEVTGQPMARLITQPTQSSSEKYYYDLGEAVNGVYNKNLMVGETDSFYVQMQLYDECHSFIKLSTKPLVKVKIYDIGLDGFEVEDNPLYNNDVVNFNIDVHLNGDVDIETFDGESFGFYISDADDNIEYYELDDTEDVSITYGMGRDDFDDIDFDNFVAQANGYKIGIYVKYDDNTSYFDEQEIEDFIYDRTPDLDIYDITIDDIEPYYEDERWDTQCDYHYSVMLDGCFFFDDLYRYYVSGWIEELIGTEDIDKADCFDEVEYIRHHGILYNSSGSNSVTYFKTYLINDEEYYFLPILRHVDGNLYISTNGDATTAKRGGNQYFYPQATEAKAYSVNLADEQELPMPQKRTK